MKTILIVGFGSIGNRHFKNILNNYKMKIIICTKRKDLGRLIGKNILVVDSISKALIHKPNIALISNETSFHVKTAIRLAKAELDLFVEKPLSSSSNGLKELEKVVSENHLVSLVGCDHRLDRKSVV